MQLNFKLDQFEGPLDLLLTLISKHKMNILDIEIITIINQYLEIINAAQAQDIHFMLADKCQQQVQRTFELVNFKI